MSTHPQLTTMRGTKTDMATSRTLPAYTELTTLILQTLATIEVPVTLVLPAPDPADEPAASVATMTVTAHGTEPAHVTTVPITILTVALFRVLDSAHGAIQQFTLQQTSANELVTSVVTLHGLTTVADTITAVNTSAPLGVPPMTALTTSASRPTITAEVFPGNHPLPDLPAWAIAMYVLSALFVFVMFGMCIPERTRQWRERREMIAEGERQFYDRLFQQRPATAKPSSDEKYSSGELSGCADPEAADYAERVRAGMQQMEEMQQNNRAVKAANPGPGAFYALKYHHKVFERPEE